MKKRIHIAAGIILSVDRKQVFITRREAKSHQGGLWEFAGGKVEVGENAQQAVIRELHEEVGIDATSLDHFLSLDHDYSDKLLSFDFFLIKQFEGEPFGKEGQPGEWAEISCLNDYPFPEANEAVLNAIVQWANSNNLG